MAQSLIGIACCLMFTHVRSTNPLMQSVIAAAVEQSPTVRQLVRTIATSDVVAYIDFIPSQTTSVAAHVSFISAVGGRRYVRISVDPRYSGSNAIALIGHELQHVAEIAAEPAIVDEKTLARSYWGWGFTTGALTELRFETDAALAAGRRVAEEVAAFQSRARSAAHAERQR
jgi:hypothetical protein